VATAGASSSTWRSISAAATSAGASSLTSSPTARPFAAARSRAPAHRPRPPRRAPAPPRRPGARASASSPRTAAAEFAHGRRRVRALGATSGATRPARRWRPGRRASRRRRTAQPRSSRRSCSHRPMLVEVRMESRSPASSWPGDKRWACDRAAAARLIVVVHRPRSSSTWPMPELSGAATRHRGRPAEVGRPRRLTAPGRGRSRRSLAQVADREPSSRDAR
jgi:hypothetical protein